MSTLYRETEALMKTKALLDDMLNDGDIDQDAYKDMIEDAGFEFHDKIENVAKFIKELESNEAGMKKAEDEIKKRRTATAKKIDWLKGYLKFCMETANIDKIEEPDIVIGFRKSQSVNITDEKRILAIFGHEETVVKYDKNEVKKALKAGDVAGAELVNNRNLYIK